MKALTYNLKQRSTLAVVHHVCLQEPNNSEAQEDHYTKTGNSRQDSLTRGGKRLSIGAASWSNQVSTQSLSILLKKQKKPKKNLFIFFPSVVEASFQKAQD